MDSIFDRYIRATGSRTAMQEFSRMVYAGLSDDQIKQKQPQLTYDNINMMRLALVNREQNARLNQIGAGKSKKSGLNVIGKFQAAESDGTPIVYYKNDVVYYENKTYVATKQTSGFSPRHENGGWKVVSLDNVIDGDTF